MLHVVMFKNQNGIYDRFKYLLFFPIDFFFFSYKKSTLLFSSPSSLLLFLFVGYIINFSYVNLYYSKLDSD